MAEKALNKLEEQLNCSICLDTYTDPKQLQCHHVYCQKCLVKLVDRDQQGQLILTCPTCRQVTPVPANGVAGLQSAFNINHLLEIINEHKKMKDLSDDDPISVSTSTSHKFKKICCPEHIDKEVELYCETCGEPICLKCVVKSGKHHGHDTELLNEAFEKYKREIEASLQPIEKQLATLNRALVEIDTRCGEISNQQEAIEVDIHDTFRYFYEALDNRKAKLIGQLHQITHSKLKGLAVQKDQVETTQAQLSSCLSFIEESLVTVGGEGKALAMKKTVVKQVNELTTSLQPGDILKPNVEADLLFSTSMDVSSVCQNFGQVIVSSSQLDPSKCHVTGKGADMAVVGEKSTAILQAVNFKGEQYKEPVALECELVSDIRTRGIVEKLTERSLYKISYQPVMKGQHQLHVKAEGHHVRGSPFSVTVKLPSKLLGMPTRTMEASKPWGIAIGQRGEVVITEWGGHRVSVFDSSGKKIRSFGKHGSGQGEFEFPRGVALDDKGNILVADSENNRIQKFTMEGTFLASVGTKGNGPLQFNNVYGIAFNVTNDKVYVVDGNQRIQILNSDLTYSSCFGKEGTGKGQFIRARGITYDKAGNIYVVDNGNHCIHVYTARGKFLRYFDNFGRKLGHPIDIAMDSNGTVYVSEAINNCISVFDSNGQYVTLFGRSIRGGEGEVNIPYGLAVDVSGFVYVSSRDCVKVFRKIVP